MAETSAIKAAASSVISSTACVGAAHKAVNDAKSAVETAERDNAGRCAELAKLLSDVEKPAHIIVDTKIVILRQDGTAIVRDAL